MPISRVKSSGVIFFSEESNYTVAKVKVYGHRESGQSQDLEAFQENNKAVYLKGPLDGNQYLMMNKE
jgi:hypothetical protein